MEKLNKADIPQEAFDLYDYYCHNKLDRRTFIEKLSVYAVGGITVAALLGSMMPDYASGRTVAAPRGVSSSRPTQVPDATRRRCQASAANISSAPATSAMITAPTENRFSSIHLLARKPIPAAGTKAIRTLPSSRRPAGSRPRRPRTTDRRAAP